MGRSHEPRSLELAFARTPKGCSYTEYHRWAQRSKSKSAIRKGNCALTLPVSKRLYALCWLPRLARVHRSRSLSSITGHPRAQSDTSGPRLADGRHQFPLQCGRSPGFDGRGGGFRRDGPRRAQEIGADPGDELALYVVHGLLHLCGYDDLETVDAVRMREREVELLARAGLINPYSREVEAVPATSDHQGVAPHPLTHKLESQPWTA